VTENDKGQHKDKLDLSGLSLDELNKLKLLLDMMEELTIEDFKAKEKQWNSKEIHHPSKPLVGRELWPDRYFVHAIGSIIFHRGGIFENQEILFFQPEMSNKETRLLLKALGFTPYNTGIEYRIIRNQSKETFTEEQAEKLKFYLKRVKVIRHVWSQEAMKPIRGLKVPWAIELGSKSSKGILKLSELEKYDLDFKIYGYYNTKNSRRLTQDQFKKWSNEHPELIQQISLGFRDSGLL